MDRPTFCRLVLDLGLVDQDRVPYFWAVSLFDEAARPVRCCAANPELAFAHLSPVLPIISKLSLIDIFHTMLKHLFADKESKAKFMASLLPIVRYRLPEHVVDECSLQ